MQFDNVFTKWLSDSHISEKTIKDFNISFNENIIIPIIDLQGRFSFNKYRRNPLSDEQPKYWYDKGGHVELFGGYKLLSEGHKTVLITEGEHDCLVAWSHNIPAVTSTGGALSFQEEWVDVLKDKDITICLDNDDAGINGMLKILSYLPHAKVLLIPELPNVKDISDYVANGGDLVELLKTARQYKTIEEVMEDRVKRIAVFQSVKFHDAYIKKHRATQNRVSRRKYSSDKINNAKLYPLENLIEFKNNKAVCPFHNDHDASLHFYKDTNTAYCFGCGKVVDSIEAYRHLHNCSFKEAVERLNEFK